MRTTLIIDDATYRDTKAAAARMGVSVGSVVEAALRDHLERLSAPTSKLPDLIAFPGAPRAGIDVDRTSALLEALDEDDRTRAQR